MLNKWVVLRDNDEDHILVETRQRARTLAKVCGGRVVKVTLALIAALTWAVKRGYDESVEFNSMLDDGFSGGIVGSDTPFEVETLTWTDKDGNLVRFMSDDGTDSGNLVEMKFNGELQGWSEETDYDYDPSMNEARDELTSMFLNSSPDDNIECPPVDVDVYCRLRTAGADSYLSARFAHDVAVDGCNVGDSVVSSVGSAMSDIDDDDGILDSSDSEESWYDVPVKGASGNGFFRYSRHLADNREDRFLSTLRAVDSASPVSLAKSFGPSGSFYAQVQADRAVCLGNGRNGRTAKSHEDLRYTREQVSVLTYAARCRLGWKVTEPISHVVAFWRNLASLKIPSPAPRSEMSERCSFPTFERVNGNALEGISPEANVKTSEDNASHVGKFLRTMFTRKWRLGDKGTEDNRGHKLWGYCERNSEDSIPDAAWQAADFWK